ncbi:hypothetical protein [Rhizobium sp. SG741]|uniref:hypothetical protein n=1 Tax=Rhizobium sp. SG741 TaxID=2587114 RepID=UPI001447DDDE|nr:hypothetical protein [Rhizobium sp. SG741]NKJ08699.1 hypothetical protein [Rhizobium sp. SG741]
MFTTNSTVIAITAAPIAAIPAIDPDKSLLGEPDAAPANLPNAGNNNEGNELMINRWKKSGLPQSFPEPARPLLPGRHGQKPRFHCPISAPPSGGALFFRNSDAKIVCQRLISTMRSRDFTKSFPNTRTTLVQS